MEPANDMKMASRTYDRFIGVIKWSVPLLAILVFLIVLMIS